MLFAGMDVHVDSHLESIEWVFPRDPFIEYEPTDERWCRFFGIGHQVRKPACYRIGDKLLIHPVLWDELRRRMEAG